MVAPAPRQPGRGLYRRRQPRRQALLRELRLRPCGRSAGAGGMSAADVLRVRTAGMGDYDSLCLLFDELDAFHRDARPEMFQPFARPVRAREQVARWLAEAGSTILVAED